MKKSRSATKPPRLTTFGLTEGRKLGSHYEVIQLLGGGSEGEVYQIRELDTGIHRAAKLYFPHVDPNSRSGPWHARKLNKLRHCDIVLQYHHTQTVSLAKNLVLCLISDFCEGEPLDKWVGKKPGKRLSPFIALHLLYTLVRGIETIHATGEYHSDIHSGNILIQPLGVRFDLKLIDFYDWGRPAKYKQQQDVLQVIQVFHECLGGRAHYSKLTPELKFICAGLQQRHLLKRFPTMSALRLHLESFAWSHLR